MSEKTLLETVLAELQTRKGTWPVIARKTGLDYDWLCKLAQGQIHDPGVRKIERLQKHFRDCPFDYEALPADDPRREPIKVAA